MRTSLNILVRNLLYIIVRSLWSRRYELHDKKYSVCKLKYNTLYSGICNAVHCVVPRIYHKMAPYVSNAPMTLNRNLNFYQSEETCLVIRHLSLQLFNHFTGGSCESIFLQLYISMRILS